MSDEFARIAEIRRRLRFDSADVMLGIGDDAAVLTRSARPQVVSVDAQVEHVHFDRAWLAPADIGHRALCAALSDLAAMGARPRAAFVAIVAPRELAEETLYGIADGFAEAQRAYGCAVAGGNLAAGSELSLTTTVIGDAPDAPLLRAGARAGDGLFVTGTLGGAALGLRALQAGRAQVAPGCVRRWRRGLARTLEGRALAGVASAAIDVSDGLLQDLGHIAGASGVGFELELDALPLDPELDPACAALGLDRYALALGGGEDYELLFTAPADASPPCGTRIGRAVEAPGIRVRREGGEFVDPGVAGFEHFRSS